MHQSYNLYDGSRSTSNSTPTKYAKLHPSLPAPVPPVSTDRCSAFGNSNIASSVLPLLPRNTIPTGSTSRIETPPPPPAPSWELTCRPGSLPREAASFIEHGSLSISLSFTTRGCYFLQCLAPAAKPMSSSGQIPGSSSSFSIVANCAGGAWEPRCSPWPFIVPHTNFTHGTQSATDARWTDFSKHPYAKSSRSTGYYWTSIFPHGSNTETSCSTHQGLLAPIGPTSPAIWFPPGSSNPVTAASIVFRVIHVFTPQHFMAHFDHQPLPDEHSCICHR